MKLAENVVDIETSGDLQSAGFGFDFNAKMADMLSNKIYSDPIGAVVREYICNATDAQGMKGALKRPVDITLPTFTNPSWEVRDYGPGLSQKDVMGEAPNFRGLFNTYGHSNKSDSNDAIGGFGLGSKAGFAYVKAEGAFTVVSWHGGEKKTYTCHRDAKGIPSVSLMHTTKSDEPTGLKISVPVNVADYNSFVEATKNVVRYMDCEFTFKGTSEDIVEKPEYIMQGDKWGLRDTTNYHYNHYFCESYSRVIMGGIAYKVDTSIMRKACMDNEVPDIYNHRFDIHIPIGSVELSVSRETLSYEQSTIDFLVNKAYDISEEIKDIITDELNGADNIFEASLKIHEYSGGILGVVARDYLNKNTWKGKKLLPSIARAEAKKGTTYSWSGNKVVLDEYRKPRHEHKVEQVKIAEYTDHLFIWADVKGPKAKVKQRLYQYCEDNDLNYLNVTFITAPSKFTFLKSFGRFLRYTNWRVLSEMKVYTGDFFNKTSSDTSTYNYQPKDKDDLRRDVSYFRCVYAYQNLRNNFLHVEVDFADNSEVKFYVPVRKYEFYEDFEGTLKSVNHSRLSNFIDAFDACDRLYCIPFNYRKYVEDNPMWVCLFDVIDDVIENTKVTSNDVNVQSLRDLPYSSTERLRLMSSFGLVPDDVYYPQEDIYGYSKHSLLRYALDAQRNYADLKDMYKGPQSDLVDYDMLIDELDEKYPFIQYIDDDLSKDKKALDKFKEFMVEHATTITEPDDGDKTND